MKVMEYGDREALKRSGLEEDIDTSHWHRFLEDLYGDPSQLSNQGSGLVLPDGIEPTLSEYRIWKIRFPGWTYGPLVAGRGSWKPDFANMQLPMNLLYERRDALTVKCRKRKRPFPDQK